MEQLTTYFTEQGVLGVIVFLLVGAVVFLFKHILTQHSNALAQNTEVVKALVESANASVQVARSMDQTNELLRGLLARQGGM